MILSVSRYTARLEEEKKAAAQAALSLQTGQTPEALHLPQGSQAQTAAEPTSRILNSDSELE